MSKLQKYIERVSNEDAEQAMLELPPEEAEQAAIIQEEELDIPEPVAEVTPELIEDAEEEVLQAEEEVAPMPEAIEESVEVEADVNEEIASIEEYTSILRHGIRTKTFSPQFAAKTQGEIKRLTETFGDEKVAVSLENYSGENLEAYYVASLETFSGFAKRLSDVLFNATKNLADKLNTKWGHDNYVKKAQALNLRADAVTGGSAKAEPAVVKGKVAARQFQIGGQFSGNPLESINRDMRFLSSEGTKLIRSIDTYLGKTMDVIESAVKDGGVGKTGDILAKVLDFKRPVDELSEVAFTGAMSGGLIFVKGENKAKEGDRRAAYKDITRSAIPTISSVAFKGEAADVTIDKASADKLAKAAKAYVALALKVVEANGLKSLQTFYRRIETQQRAVRSANSTSWGENKDLNILASKLLDMGQQQFHVYYTLLNAAFANAEHAIAMAEKAVGKGEAKAAPAAAE